MKLTYKILGAIIMIIQILPLMAQEKVKERLVIPISRPGEEVSITVEMVNGNIEISQYDGKEVLIEASASNYEDKKPKEVNGMKRISGVPFDIEAVEENNKIEINTNSWQRRIDLKISTPRNTQVIASTVHGDLTITGVSGDMEISGVNGKITFSNVSGSIISNTVNGDIKGNFLKVSPNQPMSFVTLNGDVDITFPPDIKALAKLKSERGEIYTDFDMKVTRSQPKVESKSNRYKVSIESWVTGEINGGGPEYTFKNMNGSIYVRKK